MFKIPSLTEYNSAVVITIPKLAKSYGGIVFMVAFASGVMSVRSVAITDGTHQWEDWSLSAGTSIRPGRNMETGLSNTGVEER